jgi:dsRNA-specific ribonuclease
VDESGPDHAKRFVAEALAGTEVLGRGEGHSKRAAQIQAAVEAMKRLKTAYLLSSPVCARTSASIRPTGWEGR